MEVDDHVPPDLSGGTWRVLFFKLYIYIHIIFFGDNSVQGEHLKG